MSEVVVVGSGAAGLVAALTAAREGAQVTLLEATPTIGGTTALSGGVAWLPANRHMAELGIEDDQASARRYLDNFALGDVDPALLDVFVADAPGVADLAGGHHAGGLAAAAAPRLPRRPARRALRRAVPGRVAVHPVGRGRAAGAGAQQLAAAGDPGRAEVRRAQP